MCNYHAEFGGSMSNRVCKRRGEPAKLGSARATSPWDGGRAGHLKQSPLHMCYYAQFGRSSLKSAVMDIKEPAKLGSTGDPHFGTELWLTP